MAYLRIALAQLFLSETNLTFSSSSSILTLDSCSIETAHYSKLSKEYTMSHRLNKSLLFLSLLFIPHQSTLKAESSLSSILFGIGAAVLGIGAVAWGTERLVESNNNAALPRALDAIKEIEGYQQAVALPSSENESAILALTANLMRYDTRDIGSISSRIQQLDSDLRSYKATIEYNLHKWERTDRYSQAISILSQVDRPLLYSASLSRLLMIHVAHLKLCSTTKALALQYESVRNSSSCDYSALADRYVRDRNGYAQDFTLLTFMSQYLTPDIKKLKEQCSAYGVHTTWNSYHKAQELLRELQDIQSRIITSEAYQTQLHRKKIYELQQRELAAKEREALASERRAEAAENQARAAEELVRLERRKLEQERIFNQLVPNVETVCVEFPALTIQINKIKQSFSQQDYNDREVARLLDQLRAALEGKNNNYRYR